MDKRERMNILELIRLFLELFGLGWLFLILMIAIFGGKVLVEIKNPFTKNMDRITDVTIDHQRNKNPG